MTNLPHWVQFLQALAVPAVAFLAVVIGFFQWRTADKRTSLDLFDRRYSIYAAVRVVVAQVMSSGKANMETHFKFVQARDGVEFLFGDDLIDFLEKIDRAILDLATLRPEIDALPQGEERSALIKKERLALDVVKSFYTDRKYFERYMRMTDRPNLWNIS
jgi:hypothetical protein